MSDTRQQWELDEEQQATEDRQWRDAMAALFGQEDTHPLALMLAASTPIPAWARQELAELLSPSRAFLIDADANIRACDRLVFARSQQTRRKKATLEKRAATGRFVLERKFKGKKDGAAVEDAVKMLGTEDHSYVKHSIQVARTLLRPPKSLVELRRREKTERLVERKMAERLELKKNRDRKG